MANTRRAPRQPVRPPERGERPDRPERSERAERTDRADRAERSATGALETPGEILRAARLRRRISLTEAEQATRIRQRYLQALEDDDYSVLPAGVYSVGFLRNYAIYLGVPPEEVLSGTDDRRRRRNRRVGLQSVAPPIQLSAPRTTWLFVAGGVVAVLLLALAWLGLSDPNAQNASRAPAAAAGTPAAASSPTSVVSLPPLAPAVTPTLAPTPQPTPQPTAAASPTSSARQVDVELRTVERAWVRATVDGSLAFEATLDAGQTRRWTGQRSVALRVGNGAGVSVIVNGQTIGALGPANQPVDREFTR